MSIASEPVIFDACRNRFSTEGYMGIASGFVDQLEQKQTSHSYLGQHLEGIDAKDFTQCPFSSSVLPRRCAGLRPFSASRPARPQRQTTTPTTT